MYVNYPGLGISTKDVTQINTWSTSGKLYLTLNLGTVKSIKTDKINQSPKEAEIQILSQKESD